MNKTVLLIILTLAPLMLSAQSNLVATTAAGMSEGTWAQVTQNSTISDILVCGAGTYGNLCPAGIGNLLGDSSAGAYDPFRLQFHMTGSAHNGQALYSYYDFATNNWVTPCAPIITNGSLCTRDGNPVYPITAVSVASGVSTGANHTYTNVLMDSSNSPIAQNATFDVTVVNSGHTYTVAINNPGNGMNPAVSGKTITILGTHLGGATPTNDLVISIDDSTNNAIFTHGYHFTSVDPVTGNVYYRAFGVGGNIIVYEKPQGSSVWSVIYNGPEGASSLDAMTWWSRIVLTSTAGPLFAAVPHGGANAINRGTFPILSLYRPDLSTFINVPYTGVANSNYPTEIAYDEFLNAVFFGGGTVSPKSIWRMNFDQSTPTKLCDAPVSTGYSSEGQSLGWRLVDEPGVGRLLLIGNDDLTTLTSQAYEFDPAAAGSGCTGTWTLLTGLQAPPAGMPNPNGETRGAAGITATLTNYGVLMYVGGVATTAPTVWLYKPVGGLKTFAQQCADPGVIRCNGLSTSGELQHYYSGLGPSTPIQPYGVNPINGCVPACYYDNVKLDAVTTINGDSSLKIVVPGVNSVGAPITTFSVAGLATGNATQSGISASTTSCGGSGATFDVQENTTYPGVYFVTLDTVGSGYTVGCNLVFNGANLGGSTPTNNLTVQITVGPDTGSYTINFCNGFSGAGANCALGENKDLYVLWKQYFTSNFLTNNWTSGEGFKQISLTFGDPNSSSPQASCQPVDLPTQNVFNLGFPVAYQSCTGSSSHGPYAPFQDNLPYNCDLTSSCGGSPDSSYQDARPAPYCTFYNVGLGDFGSCFKYFADEWMTFKEHVHIGPRGAGGLINTFTISGTAPGGCATTVNSLTQDAISGSGLGAAFNVTCSGGTYTAVIHDTNTTTGTRGYHYGTTGISQITIFGTRFPGGSSPANDVTITISGGQSLYNVVGAPPLDEFENSYFELWMGRDGAHTEPVIAWGPWAISADVPASNQTFGKLLLLPYDTQRSDTTHNESSTNYAHVVISTDDIADPVASGLTPPPPTVGPHASRVYIRP